MPAGAYRKVHGGEGMGGVSEASQRAGPERRTQMTSNSRGGEIAYDIRHFSESENKIKTSQKTIKLTCMN